MIEDRVPRWRWAVGGMEVFPITTIEEAFPVIQRVYG